MKEKLEQLLAEGKQRIASVATETELQDIKAALLGKQGSLTELMKGTFTITIDGDLFKASVAFDLAEPETPGDASAEAGLPETPPAESGRTPGDEAPGEGTGRDADELK